MRAEHSVHVPMIIGVIGRLLCVENERGGEIVLIPVLGCQIGLVGEGAGDLLPQ